jgi:hypothetical protein
MYKNGGDNVETYEKAYSPKEISLTLDIGDSTLRKWCIAMEKEGYHFIRNDQNKRVFIDADLVPLRHFKELVQNHHMQLENAAKIIVDRFGRGAFEPGTGIVPAELDRDSFRSDTEVISKLLEHIERQEERYEAQESFNRELLERLDKQQKYIEERLNDRDEMLLQSIREQQETKQLLLASKEEEKKVRKGLFRFFSKG